jgi:hypothetical protein
MKLIEKYKEQIEAGLKEASERWVLEPFSHNSPRWFNTDGVIEHYDKEGNEIYSWKIKSTQSALGFYIPISKEDFDFYKEDYWEDSWNEFRRFRTKWLEENYPQIPRH